MATKLILRIKDGGESRNISWSEYYDKRKLIGQYVAPAVNGEMFKYGNILRKKRKIPRYIKH